MSRNQLTNNFSIEEFDCHDGTPVPVEYEDRIKELAENLQVIRDEVGAPLKVLSGYRTPEYQMKVNPKAPNSQHPQGRAADLATRDKTPKQLHTIIERLIREKKIKQGGLGLYKGFVHYDIRGRRARWQQ